MNASKIDILVILGFGILLVTISELGLLRKLAKYALIPILGAYYLGKYVAQKQSKSL